MRKDEHGRWWSEEPHRHLVCAWDSDREEIDGSVEAFEADCEAEAAEVAQDAVHECARSGAGFACVVIAVPEWVVIAEFSVRRVATWN